MAAVRRRWTSHPSGTRVGRRGGGVIWDASQDPVGTPTCLQFLLRHWRELEGSKRENWKRIRAGRPPPGSRRGAAMRCELLREGVNAPALPGPLCHPSSYPAEKSRREPAAARRRTSTGEPRWPLTPAHSATQFTALSAVWRMPDC